MKLGKIDHRWYWLILGGIAVVVRFLLDGHPEIIEQYYSRGIFLWIRTIFDYSVAFVPFPLLYLLVLLLLLFLGKRISRFVLSDKPMGRRLLQSVFSLIAFLSGLVFLFLVCWGFNYGRLPLEKQIGISPKPLKLAELRQELENHSPILHAQRQMIPKSDSIAFTRSAIPQRLRKKVKADLEQTLSQLSYPNTGSPRARLLRPKGILLRISTAGFYLPFTGECNIDAGLHPLQLPFVMAHEYAHAYGITDEGSCNFLAYLACTQSDDPFIRYSGHLSYWRYLAGNYLSFRPKEYTAFRRTLPKGIIADLNAINDNAMKYPDILPAVRDFAYDSYLKAQGVEEGIESYSRIIMLVKAWKRKQGE